VRGIPCEMSSFQLAPQLNLPPTHTAQDSRSQLAQGNTSQAGMAAPAPRLLLLPAEIRDLIITEAVIAAARPAPHPTELKHHERRTIPVSESAAWSGSERVFFEKPMPNLVLPLLLTNWQLHHETRDTVRRLKNTQPLRYTLDVVFLQYRTVWPTWLSVPAPAPHVDEVRVQFRLVNSYDPEAEVKAKRLFESGLGEPASIAWIFYHLMVVMASKNAAPYGQPFTVGRLILDVLPAEKGDILPMRRKCCSSYFRGGERVEYFGPVLRRPEEERDGDPRVRAAEVCLRFIKREIRDLVGLSQYTFEYGKWIYENIGEIEYRLAGELDAEAKLATKLDAGVPHWGLGRHSYGGDKWQSRYFPWSETIKARRRQIGLPVIEAEPVTETESVVLGESGSVSSNLWLHGVLTRFLACAKELGTHQQGVCRRSLVLSLQVEP